MLTGSHHTPLSMAPSVHHQILRIVHTFSLHIQEHWQGGVSNVLSVNMSLQSSNRSPHLSKSQVQEWHLAGEATILAQVT